MAGRGVAESLTSRGINRPPSATTISTSAPAVVRQKYTRGLLGGLHGLDCLVQGHFRFGGFRFRRSLFRGLGRIHCLIQGFLGP
jgi:hypothetical protein